MINLLKNVKFHYLLLGFFILVIIVNIAYIFIAKKTWRGRAVEKIIYKSNNQIIFEEKKITNYSTSIIQREIENNKISKSIIAQHFAQLLDDDSLLTPAQIRAEVSIQYLVEAIEHVCH